MKIRTQDLTGADLDWAVAKCEALPVALHSTGAIYLIVTPWANKSRVKWLAEFSPTRHWAQGGPIIDRERITIRYWANTSSVHAYVPAEGSSAWYEGETALIAAMRCYVASKLGDEVDVPEELT